MTAIIKCDGCGDTGCSVTGTITNRWVSQAEFKEVTTKYDLCDKCFLSAITHLGINKHELEIERENEKFRKILNRKSRRK